MTDTTALLALRLVSRDWRDNTALAFEEIISEVRIGGSECSLDRLTTLSKDLYHSRHVKQIIVCTRTCWADAGDAGVSNGFLQHYINFQNSEILMLDSGVITVKISDALKELPNCLSIVLGDNSASSECAKMWTRTGGWHQGDGRERSPEVERIPCAVASAIVHAGISLRELKVMLDDHGSMLISAFGPCNVRLAQPRKSFSSIKTLKLQVRCWESGTTDDFSQFVDFVNSFRSVTTLELSLHEPDPDLEPESGDRLIPDLILRRIRLPKLRALVLNLMVTDGQSLASFLHDHSASLRTLRIYNIGFSSAMECIALFQRLVGKMQLQELKVVALWSFGDPTLDRRWLGTLGMQTEDNSVHFTPEAVKSIVRQILVGGD